MTSSDKTEPKLTDPKGKHAATAEGVAGAASATDPTPAAAPMSEPGLTAGSAPEPVPTAAELKELKQQAAKSKEYWDQLLRTAAEFENFKKRVARERQDAAKYAFEPLLQKLIPVLDNFDMALAAAGNAQQASVQSLQVGITMVHQQLRQALTDAGLAEIEAAGQPFDPNWHEAVSQQESATVPDGHVIQQLRRGYKLRDRLLRPAGVVVAKKVST